MDEVISDAPPLTVRVEISCNVAAIQGDWDHASRVFSAYTPKTSQWLAQSIKPELLDAIDAVLPPQPWLRHMHVQVAENLAPSKAFVRKAIQELIRQGRRLDQVGGKIVQRSREVDEAQSISARAKSRMTISLGILPARCTPVMAIGGRGQG